MSPRIRGKQEAYGLGFDDVLDKPRSTSSPRSRFTKLVGFWIPKRFLRGRGVDLLGFIADLNEKIEERGFVLSDGQVLTKPLSHLASSDTPRLVAAPEGSLINFVRVGARTEVTIETDSASFDLPKRRPWGHLQRAFFGLENPYQMAEDGEAFSWSWLSTVIEEPYLQAEERILAVVHGVADNYYFYCPCHSADVVYTSRHRLVCMGCGGTHIVLAEPLKVTATHPLTAQNWVDYFDDDGVMRDHELELKVVDFAELEVAATIWETEQWEEAKHRFVFFARSSPEEIADAIRGTEADPSIFLEAGFTPVALTPPPAEQIDSASIDLSIVDNAAEALREGCAAFLAARREPSRLATAISQLFRAIELIFKARLLELDSSALNDQPNNPTVVKRLIAAGVTLVEGEGDAVRRLRKLRNEIQHGGSSFNYRTGLTLCRKAIVLLDRFAWRELELWIGDAITADDWNDLLRLPELGSIASEVVKERVEIARKNGLSQLSKCGRCENDTMLRPHPKSGASCLRCGFIPVVDAGDEGDDTE